MSKGKRYTQEFKIEAVKQVTDRGYSIAEVSERLGINQVLSNVYLKYQGLYELRDGWIKLHYSK